MDLYQFASKVSAKNQYENPQESVGQFTNKGRNDTIAEAQDRYERKLQGRAPLVYKLKAMAKQSALEKYPQGAVIEGARLNRNLFDGMNPWTYSDWGNQPVEELEDDHKYEIIGYIDQTYISGQWIKGHIYLVLTAISSL